MSRKKQLNLLCSIIAIFCVISVYMPVVAPRYPAGAYYAASDAYLQDYFFTGDYYWAREYWSISRYVFSDQSVLLRILLSITEGLLLFWALYSVKGEAGRMGLLAAGLNLLVTGFVLIRMLAVKGYCLWGVLAVMVLVTLVTAVLAVGQYLGAKADPADARGRRGQSAG